jgi:NADPH:quinone reductase-like Zn-dependent oxidoreductase
MEEPMKAIIAKRGSDAQDAGAFVMEEQPMPEPGSQDLLVRVVAIGMNPVDTKVRQRSDKDGVLGWDA